MPTNTSRLGLTVPVTTDAPLIPANLLTLANQLDALVAGFYSGTAANRSSVVSSPDAGNVYLATDTLEFSMYSGSAWVDMGPITPGRLLASQQYAPPGGVTLSPGTSLAALDATNATLAFTVPSSGNADVTASFYGLLGNTITGFAGLLNHTGGAQVGFTMKWGANVENVNGDMVYLRWHLTGLTPGAIQLDLATAYSGSGSSLSIFAGGNTGIAGSPAPPLLLQAFAA